jgi:hypothetical protein
MVKFGLRRRVSATYLRFVHLALERVGRREAYVGPLRAFAGVERLVICVGRRFEMTSGKFYVAQLPVPVHLPGSSGLNRIACFMSDLASSRRLRDISANAR